MLLKNVRYYGSDFRFHFGDVRAEGGRFLAPVPRDGDAQGAPLVLPGLVDLHLHGNSGEDFSNGVYDGLVTMARFLARQGTTAFSPASMTLPEQALGNAFETAVQFRRAALPDAAALCGITMEGPFFSAEKCGAQNPAFLLPPDAEMFFRLQTRAEGLVRIACVAPELPGAAAFIRRVSAAGVTVSIAHTGADYETAAAAFDAGAAHVTHLYNAMPPLLHRAPGVIGAASERETVSAELICDGVHVHPSAVRAAFRLFGPARICLISDAIAACGMPDGSYALGGQAVTVKDGRATIASGSLAGSTATLLFCVKQAVAMGVPLEDAVRCATANPARVLGARDVGVIEAGRRADCLVCDDTLNLQTVYLAGERL